MEFFADGPNAGFFAPAILRITDLIVPTISVYEVFKKILAETGEANSALQAVTQMKQGEIVDLTEDLALEAATLSHELKLPMADSIILATARKRNATLWTQDADFEKLPGIKYVRKK
jgi:predicted nucleic acid-binding protein